MANLTDPDKYELHMCDCRVVYVECVAPADYVAESHTVGEYGVVAIYEHLLGGRCVYDVCCKDGTIKRLFNVTKAYYGPQTEDS